MRYELSLKGDTFTPVVEAFDRRLLATLDRMQYTSMCGKEKDIQNETMKLCNMPCRGCMSRAGQKMNF